MKQSSAGSKKCFSLPDLDHRLAMYALAASAAGVGVLALTLPAEGKIVYTKAHELINPNTTVAIDLNHDGIRDFVLKDIYSLYEASAFGQLSVLPARSKNAIWGHTIRSKGYASALFANVRIGPQGRFLPGAGLMATTSADGGLDRLPNAESCFGPWANVRNRYLGLKFTIAGKTHFGWARLDVSCDTGSVQVTGVLTGYAYETVANRPVIAGKKSGPDKPDDSVPAASMSGTLGQLAKGSHYPAIQTK
jgi:hypothetical protein